MILINTQSLNSITIIFTLFKFWITTKQYKYVYRIQKLQILKKKNSTKGIKTDSSWVEHTGDVYWLQQGDSFLKNWMLDQIYFLGQKS